MPYVVINKEHLQIVGAVSTATIAAQIEMVYFKDVPTCVLNPDEGKTLSQLSELELKMLLNSLAIPTEGCDYKTMIGYLKYFCENHPITDPNQESLDYIQGIIRHEVMKAPERPDNEPVKARKSSAPSDGSAPSPKGATGRVWAIADEVLVGCGGTLEGLNLKDLRKAIIDRCTEAGIHEATAATQWSKWKKSKGF